MHSSRRLNLTYRGRWEFSITETPYANDVFTRGLWHFDEADGVMSISDASGNNLGAVCRIDSARYFEERIESAIQFNGDGGQIQIANNDLLNVYNVPFTLELWFYILYKPTATAILAKRGIGRPSKSKFVERRGANQGLAAASGTERTELAVRTGTIETFGTTQWYHAAFSWDGDSCASISTEFIRRAGPLRFVSKYRQSAARDRRRFGRLESISRNHRRSPSLFDCPGALGVQRQSFPTAGLARDHPVWRRDRRRASPASIHAAERGRRRSCRARDLGNRQPYFRQFGGEFFLDSGQDTTLWLTFSPTVSGSLPPNTVLVITKADPTHPQLEIPITGRSVDTFTAGTLKTDPFTFALYHFSNVRETTIFDSSGHGFDGVLHGGIQLNSKDGKFGQYLWVNGVQEYCSVDSLIPSGLGTQLGRFHGRSMDLSQPIAGGQQRDRPQTRNGRRDGFDIRVNNWLRDRPILEFHRKYYLRDFPGF